MQSCTILIIKIIILKFHLPTNPNYLSHQKPSSNRVSYYYEFSKEQDYICSKPEDSGMHLCSDLPPYRMGPMVCTGKPLNNCTKPSTIINFYRSKQLEKAIPMTENLPTNSSCVNWNQYYSRCAQMGLNPFQGTISFDNIGMAWVAIFLVRISPIHLPSSIFHQFKKGKCKIFEKKRKIS